ncbi:HlyC/CorC family transporter [Jannaschia sp. Os4]|nr:hemolysin family protein [Jannaschia sp. Os4]MBM2576251.1 HlyC/CorC family transporter [Jannaschia sp. Os4]
MAPDGQRADAAPAPSEDTTTGADPESPDARSEPRPGLLARLMGRTAPDAPSPDAPTVAPPGLVALRSKRLDDVLIPRAEVVAVPVDTALTDLVQTFRESGNTRLPVFEETLDQPLGMVHLKDVALQHGFNGSAKDFDLRAILRTLIYAPPSMPIGVLLAKMQTQRTHMALVIDEYGGVDGLVTLEDLIEQVIGEIADEHDEVEGKPWRQERAGCFLALARTPLPEFEAEIGMRLAEEGDEEEYDTLGGLVFSLAGRVPERGEVLEHPSGATLEVVDADPRRIKRVRVRLPA